MAVPAVLLVNAPSPNPGAILSHRVQGLPPLGICYIASWLTMNGYPTEILDFYIRTVSLKDLEATIKKNQPRLIGISTTTETFKCGIRLARQIKKISQDIIIIMGGSHVTFEFSEALKSGVIDYVIRGEGEITAKELCDHCLRNQGNIEDIHGLSYIRDGVIVSNKDRGFIADLDTLPFPDRTLLDISKYSHPASISTSRGCPGRCIFCAASALSGGKYRMRSPSNVISEIEYLVGLGFQHIQIVDDTLTANAKRLNKILDMLIDRKIDVAWAAESRVDSVDEALLKKMHSAGCKSLQFGVEAGNQKMLDSLKKNITLEQVRKVFKLCSEIGISAASCLIIGQPYDTPETIMETVKIGLELQELGAQIVFSISTPYPGTYMYSHAQDLGLEIVDFDTDNYTTQSAVYNSKHLSAVEIQNSFTQACVLLAQQNKNASTKQKYKEVRDEAMKITHEAAR